MERKRPKLQNSSDSISKRKATSKSIGTLKIKQETEETSKHHTDAIFSPVDLSLCKFEEKDDASSTIQKLIQIEPSFCGESLSPKLLSNFFKVSQRLTHRFSQNLDIHVMLIRLCTRAVSMVPSFATDLKDLFLSLINSDSLEIRAAVFKALVSTQDIWSDDASLVREFHRVATENVAVQPHTTRLRAMALLGTLAQCSTDLATSVLADLSHGCNDGDARVREVSLQSLLGCQEKGLALNMDIYDKTKKACNDDFERVRLVAMKIVKLIAFQHSDWVVPLPDNAEVELLLIDDAFIQICDMINDWSVGVRIQAAKFLGEFHKVSDKFLQQTLDKKLMSGLKRVKSGHERQRGMYQGGSSSGNWDSGKQLVGVIPQLDLGAEEVTIMNQGACGAFVHALEDEFKEVRLAAVQAMEILSAGNKDFGSACLDHLIDMFNDEIEEVRIKSISSIRKIMTHISLREDQLDLVLGSLKDVSAGMRRSLQTLLSLSSIPSLKGMQATVTSLLANLAKYQADKESIWRCLRRLGSSHCELIAALVPSLLSTHPFLMTAEPNITDPAYTCILILVFNACTSCPTIPPLFPSHIYRHFSYLRDLLPDLVPDLKLPVKGLQAKAVRPKGEESHSFLLQCLEKTQFAISLPNLANAQGLLGVCIQDLIHVAEMDNQLRPSALFAAMFRQSQLLLLKISQFVKPWKAVSLSSEAGVAVLKCLERVEKLSHKMEHLFCGLADAVLTKLCLLRFIVQSLSLMMLLRRAGNFDQQIVSDCVLTFSAGLQHLTTVFGKSGCALPDFVQDTKTQLSLFTSDNLSQLESSILATFESFRDLRLEAKDVQNLRMVSVEVEEPVPRSHSAPLKFLASLALSLKVHVKVVNLDDLSSLAIQASMPDGEVMLFRPKPGDWFSPASNENILQTSVILSSGPWTDPCRVEISVVKVYPRVSMETKYSSVLQCVRELTSKVKMKVEMGTCTNVGIFDLTDMDCLEYGTICLTTPIYTYIHPQPE